MKLLRRAYVAFVSLVATAPAALAAPAAAEDIRDIRAPLAIPPWWRWPLAIGVAALLALGIVLLVRWWQRRRAAALTPLERALQALLAAETHARAGRAHEWADLVAESLRAALAARLGADVLPQTTSELAKSAWAAEPPREGEPAADAPPLPEAPRVLELLRACDLARFAQATLDVDALVDATVAARALVQALFAPPPRTTTPSLQPATVTP